MATDGRFGRRDDVRVRLGIVEGEPGIFPDPVARALRALAALVRRGRPVEPPQGEKAVPAPRHADAPPDADSA